MYSILLAIVNIVLPFFLTYPAHRIFPDSVLCGFMLLTFWLCIWYFWVSSNQPVALLRCQMAPSCADVSLRI